MIRRSLQQTASMIGADLSDASYENRQIYGVSTDTRTIQPGNLFVPLIGNQFDGHLYAEEALAKGAAASLWQKDRPNPPAGMPLIQVEDTLAALQQLAHVYRNELPVRVIGITGSNGKTTTKDLVGSVLSTTFKVHKTKGNLNNHIGLPLTLLQLEEDTEVAVLEMGMSDRGEIEFLSKLAQPEIAMITMIGESHLMQLGSREEIARAKTEILSGLQVGGLFIYNGDEVLVEKVLPEMKVPENMQRIRFGKQTTNDLYPSGIRLDLEGTHFTVNECDSPQFFIPLLGEHNVVNALAAIAVSEYMGVNESDLLHGLKSLQMTSMRIEKCTASSGLTILNDAYNASPTSMKAALQLMEQLSGYERKFVVLGDMLELGDQESEFHREIGQLLSPEYIDYVFTFGGLAKHIAQQAAKVYTSDKVRSFEEKEELTAELLKLVGPGDMVLVKGSRGMKLEQVVQALLS